jgi:hypothetical protein
MHLADEVLPAVPIRQWVLSFPYPLRLALAYDAALCASVRRILVRTLLGWHSARAALAGVARGRSGAVVVAQRFGSALNLNLHFHALVLDGVYASPDPFTRPRFHPAKPLTDRDVEELTSLLHRRAWHESRKARDEVERREHDGTRAVLPVPPQAVDDSVVLGERQALARDRRAEALLGRHDPVAPFGRRREDAVVGQEMAARTIRLDKRGPHMPWGAPSCRGAVVTVLQIRQRRRPSVYSVTSGTMRGISIT